MWRQLDNCGACETLPLDAVCGRNLSRANWLCILGLDGAVVGVLRNVSVKADVAKALADRVQLGGAAAHYRWF